MIRHFAADGTVKREWPDGLHASGFEQDGKRFASVAKSNAVETVELADGEQEKRLLRRLQAPWPRQMFIRLKPR